MKQHKQGPLQGMLDAQWEAQCEYYGTAPGELVQERRSDYARTMAFALNDEVSEAMQEIAWKPWSSDHTKFNREAFQQELIDALFFWMNLWLLSSGSADELVSMFDKVTEKNRARRADGYDARKDQNGRQFDGK